MKTVKSPFTINVNENKTYDLYYDDKLIKKGFESYKQAYKYLHKLPQYYLNNSEIELDGYLTKSECEEKVKTE